MSRSVILLLAVILGGITACSRREEPPEDSPSDRGSRLFVQLGCLGCHRLGGRGGMLEGVTVRHDEDWFGSYLENPSLERPDAMMPPYHLDPAQRADLWAYLQFRDSTRAPVASDPLVP